MGIAELLHPDYSRPDLIRLVPQHLQRGLSAYIELGQKPGGDLWAILGNENAFNVVAHCDDQTFDGLRAIYGFLYHYAPSNCWGHPLLCRTWCETGGLRGRGAGLTGGTKAAPDEPI